MKKVNRNVFVTATIFFILISVYSFNISNDWAKAISKAAAGSFVIAFIYLIGYLNGQEEGKGVGYEKALKELGPLLPKTEKSE